MTDKVEAHILAEYKLLKKVGSGAYGHVWKVQEVSSKKQLALKKIFDAFQHSTDAQRTLRQITLLYQLCHPQVIKLHKVYPSENDKDLYLVFEYMEADLHNAIGQNILRDLHLRYVMYQIVLGVKYLHDSNIIHRDLKPSNLLINSDCSVKICDLGLARTVLQQCDRQKNAQNNSQNIFTEEVATRWYRAPEVLLGSQNYSQSADMWSVGCILAEMILGKPIFPGNSTLNQLERIIEFTGKPSQSDIDSLQSTVAPSMIKSLNIGRKYKTQADWFRKKMLDSNKSEDIFHHEAIDLITKLIKFNPNERLNAEDTLKHPYVRQFISNEKKSQLNSQTPKKIFASVSENSKKSVKEYKRLIHQWIAERYPQTMTVKRVIKEKTPLKQQKSKNCSVNKVQSYSSFNKELKHVSSLKHWKNGLEASKQDSNITKENIRNSTEKQNEKDPDVLFNRSLPSESFKKKTAYVAPKYVGRGSFSPLTPNNRVGGSGNHPKYARHSSHQSLLVRNNESFSASLTKNNPPLKEHKELDESYSKLKKSQPYSPIGFAGGSRHTNSQNNLDRHWSRNGKVSCTGFQKWKAVRKNSFENQEKEILTPVVNRTSNGKAYLSSSALHTRMDKISSSCSLVSSPKATTQGSKFLEKRANPTIKKRYSNHQQC